MISPVSKFITASAGQLPGLLNTLDTPGGVFTETGALNPALDSALQAISPNIRGALNSTQLGQALLNAEAASATALRGALDNNSNALLREATRLGQVAREGLNSLEQRLKSDPNQGADLRTPSDPINRLANLIQHSGTPVATALRTLNTPDNALFSPNGDFIPPIEGAFKEINASVRQRLQNTALGQALLEAERQSAARLDLALIRQIDPLLFQPDPFGGPDPELTPLGELAQAGLAKLIERRVQALPKGTEVRVSPKGGGGLSQIAPVEDLEATGGLVSLVGNNALAPIFYRETKVSLPQTSITLLGEERFQFYRNTPIYPFDRTDPKIEVIGL